MDHDVSDSREVIQLFEQEYADLLAGLTAFIRSVPSQLLYQPPDGANLPDATVGEDVLKCAAVVEQLFGGLTANLWDDPFEWTLPETLSTSDLVEQYIGEVDATRKRAFASFANDGVLLKHIAVPSGESRPLMSLLLETLVRASGYQGRAIATRKILSDVGAPRFII